MLVKFLKKRFQIYLKLFFFEIPHVKLKYKYNVKLLFLNIHDKTYLKYQTIDYFNLKDY